MHQGEEVFQEAIERLAAGEPLEVCKQGLPEQDHGALALAARLQATGWPEQEPGRVRAQRKRLVDTYYKETNMENQGVSRLSNLFKDWRTFAILGAGLVILAACILTASAGAGWLLFNNQRQAAFDPTSTTGEVAAAHPTQARATQPVQAPQTAAEARLSELQGLVEIHHGEAWQAAQPGALAAAGTRIRTGELSSVTLELLDGSRVKLGAFSEITIDQLQAQPGGAGRKVTLTQSSGESQHEVAPVEGGDSQYKVLASTSQGIAKGTRFHVRVVSGQAAWFVDEGQVEVTGKDTSVQVAAGQMTYVNPEKKPRLPMGLITGQGEVSFIGDTWVIAGQTFQLHRRTVVIGNPQVGDIVFYEGHLGSAGERIADLIVLIRPNPAQTFTLTGEVQAIADTRWTINGQAVGITETTRIEAGIVVGDLVRAKGLILEDGSLLAQEIVSIDEEPGTPFDFTGVVQQVGETSWVISGITITVNTETHLDADLAAGDLVRAQGWILADGSWLARSITRAVDETALFEINGILESLDPWIVAGLGFETREWTHIDEGLRVGDRVHVEGVILPDGTWVAYEIRRLGDPQLTILIGRVFSINPWVVSGFALNVDGHTEIVGDITVGMLVRVELLLQPDGTHRVIRIEPLDRFWWWWEPGCHSIIVILDHLDDDHLFIYGWPGLFLDDDLVLPGDLRPGAVIQIQICYDPDGRITIITIIIIYQYEPPPPPDDDDSGWVTICHKPYSHPQTKIVPPSALSGHLGHGDTLGACGGGDDWDDWDDDDDHDDDDDDD